MSEMQTPKKNNSLMIIIIGALVVLNIVLIYISLQGKSDSKALASEVSAKEIQLKEATANLDSLNAALETKIAEVNRLGGDTTVLGQMKRDLQKDLIIAKNANSGDKAKIKELQQKIATYMQMLADRDEEINQLKAERARFNEDNNSLRTQVARSADSLSKIDADRRELASKVNMASVLRAEEFITFALDRKGRETEDVAFKAKRVDQLGVEFRLGDNKVAKLENKEIMLCVVNQAGAVLSDPATGGGTFTLNGKETNYSAKQSVLFDNSGQRIEFKWRPTEALAPGIYTLDVYSEGFKIGSTGVEIYK